MGQNTEGGMKKLTGGLLIAAPFIGIAWIGVYKYGVLYTAGAFAFALVIMALVSAGTWLVTD
jgi:hypothetical protein